MATQIPKNRATFTVAELVAICAGALRAPGAAAGCTSISTSSRDIAPGGAFVALRGPNHDGHDHVAGAAAAGAVVAIVERDVDAPAEMAVVRVESTLRALGDLARAHVGRWRQVGARTLVGITGSAGKTTTRVATAALVESLFPGQLIATRGNLNNRIGVPMMLFSLDSTHRACVVELGTSEPGEIEELCRIAQPDVGILTLIAAAHLDGLGSLDGVEQEKAALLRALPREGVAVGNGDDARVGRVLDESPATRRIRYGRSGSAEVRVVERTPIGVTSSNLVIRHADGRTSTFDTPLVGEAGALACAGAIAAVEAAFGARLDGEQLGNAFRRVELGEGAQRLVPLALSSGLTVIDDTYNANPTSMAASIRAVVEMSTAMSRPLVLVLGEMRELGTEAAAGHDDVGRVAAASSARLVVAIGSGEAHRMADQARAAGIHVLFAPSVDDGLTAVLAAISASDMVLVKGSRSVGTDRIVAELERRHGGSAAREEALP